MKLLKGTLATLAILGIIAGFGWFFISQLSTGPVRSDEPAGVLLSAPPDFDVVERGAMSPSAAAAELETQTLRRGAGKVGIHFKRQSAEVYWLADSGADLLEERSAGPSGTRLQTVWQRGLRQRLAWARIHGTFDVPGLPAGERKNLYH